MSAAEETEASTPTAANVTGEQEASDPKTFDLAAWIEGVQPVTHAVRLYARGDLLSDLDLVKAQIENAKVGRDYDAVKVLREQAGEIVEALEATALDVVVEGWSQSRVEAFQKPLKAEGVSDEDVIVRQTVAQVVEPEGFTAELFESLMERIYPQAMQVVAAAVAANNRAPVVALPS